MQQMAIALIQGDAPGLLELIDQLVMAGRDLARFVTDLAQHLRNILICQVSQNPHLLVRAASDTLEGMKQLAGQVSGDELIDLIKGLSALLSDLRWAADARTALEIGLIRLMSSRSTANNRPQAVVSQTPPAKAAPTFTTALAAAPVVSPVTAHASRPVEPPPLAPVKAAAPVEQPVFTDDPGPVPPPIDDDMPLPEPEPERQREPEPEPTTSESKGNDQMTEPAAVAAVPASAAPAVDAATLWQKVLDHLLGEGHMTLYLFCRPIRPELVGDQLRLHFAATDHVNYQEISHAASIKILRAAASRLLGHDIHVQPILTGSQAKKQAAEDLAVPAEDDWIQKIRKTADTLGIPVKMED